MSNQLYSQTGLPRAILYNGDSVEIMSMHQLQMLNMAHETWLECRDENDSLLVVLDSCSTAFGAYNDAISALRYQAELQQIANQQKLQVIDTMHQVINSQKKQIHKLKARKTLDNITEGILAGIIVWLVIR